MIRKPVVIMIVAALFTMCLCACAKISLPSADKTADSTISPEASPIPSLPPSAEPTNSIPVTAGQDAASETFGIYDIHSDYYNDAMLVDAYIKLWFGSIDPDNKYNADDFKDFLDEKSGIYERELQKLQDYMSRGIELTYPDTHYEDLRPVSDTLYDVYYAIDYEEISPNQTKTEKTLFQIFTVYDDGVTLKITDIKTLDKDYVKLGQKAASDCLTAMFGGTKVDDIVNKLGEPVKKEERTYDERWTFQRGEEIDIDRGYAADDTTGKPDAPPCLSLKNYVYISPQSTLKTDSGIGIGSTYDAVMTAYHDEIYLALTTGDLISVGVGYINFVITDNKVSSIYIRIGSASVSPEYYGDFKPDRS